MGLKYSLDQPSQWSSCLRLRHVSPATKDFHPTSVASAVRRKVANASFRICPKRSRRYAHLSQTQPRRGVGVPDEAMPSLVSPEGTLFVITDTRCRWA